MDVFTEHNKLAIFVFENYRALKLHLTKPNFDFFKYNGKTSGRISSEEQYNEFIKSKNYPLANTIARRLRNKQGIIEFLIANLERDPCIWLDKLRDSYCDDIMIKWKQRQESITYTFIKDLNFILSQKKPFRKYFTKDSSGYSDILNHVIREEICIETACILDWILDFIGEDLGDETKDFIVYDTNLKIKKYGILFVAYHNFGNEAKNKFKKIIQEKKDKQLDQLPF